MIRIFALDGLQLLHCAVSKAALVALEDDALDGPHAMAETYRRNQALVQEIAKANTWRAVLNSATPSWCGWTM
jgi:hypothetical protein